MMNARNFLACILALMWALTCTVLIASAQQQRAAAQGGNFQISGILVDSITGQPLAKARVAISPVNERNNFSTMVTVADGRFLFVNLASGKYTLTAQARGYLLQSFNQHDQYSSSIVVGPGVESSNLIFRLPPESSIAGVVTDEAGEPVRDAQVMLYFVGLATGSEGTRLRGRVVTDDEGAYHFGHLAPGHYLLAVSAKPWYARHPLPVVTASTQNQDAVVLRSGTVSSLASVSVRSGPPAATTAVQEPTPPLDVAYPVTFYPGVTEASEATPIALGRGEKAQANVTLQPVPALHVHIKKEESEPGKSTQIMLQRSVLGAAPLPVPGEVRQIDDGMTEITGIPAGRYTIRNYVAKAGSVDWTGSRDVELSADGEISSNQGDPFIPVTATLQLRSGALPKQAILVLSSKKTGQAFNERVNSSSELVFKQGVPPGAYEVSLAGASGLYLSAISAEGAKASGRTIEFRAGSPARLAITVAQGQAEVTGTALRDGKAVAGAMVVLVPADPGHNHVLFRRDQSDSDGTFSLPQVVPGDYKLLAIENGWELQWMNPEVLKSYMAGAVAVQAQPNGKYTVKVSVQ
jgi:uncharacterized surface anchored protein